MTQEDIIRMAREAGLYTKCEVHSAVPFDQLLKRFAALVAAAERANLYKEMNDPLVEMGKKLVADEREACAKVAETRIWAGELVAAAIRARGQA